MLKYFFKNIDLYYDTAGKITFVSSEGFINLMFSMFKAFRTLFIGKHHFFYYYSSYWV